MEKPFWHPKSDQGFARHDPQKVPATPMAQPMPQQMPMQPQPQQPAMPMPKHGWSKKK
jgi:hypothetical protein